MAMRMGRWGQIWRLMPARTLVRAALASACVAGFSGAAVAQTTFTMNTSSASYPNAGWSGGAIAPNASFSRQHVGSIGPGGRGVILLRQISNRTAQFSGGQFGWGWRGQIESAEPAQGSLRYYRWIFRFTPETNFLGVDWSNGGNADYLSNKMFILGDGGDGNRQRIIVESLEADPRQSGRFRLRLGIDGGETAVYTSNLLAGTWYHVQIEARSSSSGSSNNGRYSLWVNNNNYGSPTITNGDFLLRTQRWNWAHIGAFVNFGIQANGVHDLQVAGFESGLSFDANWFSGGGGSTPAPPAAPQNVRIATAADAWLLASAVAGSIFTVRRRRTRSRRG